MALPLTMMVRDSWKLPAVVPITVARMVLVPGLAGALKVNGIAPSSPGMLPVVESTRTLLRPTPVGCVAERLTVQLLRLPAGQYSLEMVPPPTAVTVMAETAPIELAWPLALRRARLKIAGVLIRTGPLSSSLVVGLTLRLRATLLSCCTVSMPIVYWPK